MFLMDGRRCLNPLRFGFLFLGILVLLLANDWDMIAWYLSENLEEEMLYDIVDFAMDILMFDRYKIVIVFFLGAIYTSSVCEDDNSNYLRMILSRVDLTIYTQSRFLVNTLIILLASLLSFFAFALLLSIYFPLWNPELESRTFYYQSVIDFSPLLYIGMMALQFGIIVAACSSIGILFSAYQSNAFVSIGLTGVSFFCALSYMPASTPFYILNLICMQPACSAFSSLSPIQNYMWGMLFPCFVIVLCGYLFYRRMKWRMSNGFI